MKRWLIFGLILLLPAFGWAADGDPLIEGGGAVTVDEIAAATLVTEAEGISSNDNDTTIPTSAAVKAYADSVGGGGGGAENTVQTLDTDDGTGTPNVVTIDLDDGQIVLLTMIEDSEIAFSNVPAGYCRVIVRFIQDGGGDEPWTNQDDFLWPLGVEMDLSTTAAAKDDFQFYTYDGGTSWTAVMIAAEVQ